MVTAEKSLIVVEALEPAGKSIDLASNLTVGIEAEYCSGATVGTVVYGPLTTFNGDLSIAECS